MSLFLSHWHCILPAAGLIIAAILMCGRQKNKNDEENN